VAETWRPLWLGTYNVRNGINELGKSTVEANDDDGFTAA
jgi:hypothetical protein